MKLRNAGYILRIEQHMFDLWEIYKEVKFYYV